jgi:hypothetical protein
VKGSSHPDPAVQHRANELLREAGYTIFEKSSSPEHVRLSLRRLRIKAFLIWPLALFVLAEIGWFLEAKLRFVSWFVFVLSLWVLFFRAYRELCKLYTFTCPVCGERFFFTKVGWLFGWGNVWSNTCVHCGYHAT